MNKKRFLSVLSAAAASVFLAQAAGAAENPEIKVDFDNGIITVSGTAVGNEEVFLEVLNPGVNADEIDSLGTEAQLGMFDHVEQKSAADGKYSFSYKTDGEAGRYTVLVKSTSDTEPAVSGFNFEKSDITAQSLQTLNGYINAKDAEEIKNYLNDNSDLYFEDAVYYKDLSDEGKTKVAEGLIEAGAAAAMSDAKNTVIRYSAIQELYEAESDLQRGKLLLEYAEELGISSTAEYPFIKAEDDEFITNLGSRMKAERYAAYSEFLSAYKTAMCLTGVKNAENVGLIKGIIRRASDSGVISVPKYMALQSTAAIDQKIVKRDFSTAAELASTIENLAAAGGNTYGGGGGGAGGSGNSGGGGASGSVYAPVASTPDTGSNEQITFADLTNEHWAYESILCLKKHGSLNGYEDNTFKPDINVTRREFLKIALTSFDIEDKGAVCSFNDISESDWCYLWIATAQSLDIISGDENGNFNGDDNITRQDAAKILNGILTFKSYNIPAKRTYAEFADDGDISDYAIEGVKMFYCAEVINGYEDGRFRPKEPSTRAEAAKMIFSVLQKIGG
ncbi:MAG: S-layer homology domain-containing protein [Clostridia bacterium]|nr:S-layer homology domain-containing protein [Clostridia bacterium]